MAMVRGILVVVACGLLFAAGGGPIAGALNWLAPWYYPGVFPHANRHGYAADVGVATGILQGLMLGLLVGAVVAVGLGWFGQLRWAACGRGLAIVGGCAAVVAVGGGLVGLALGVLMPSYYRGVVSGGQQPDCGVNTQRACGGWMVQRAVPPKT